MYVDASAIVAILVGEADAGPIVARLGEADKRMTSVVSAFEAMVAVAGMLRDRPAAIDAVRELLDLCEIRLADAGWEILDRLAEAHLRFGRGSDHPAQLDMGGCFAYATARAAGVPILHVGEDFAFTDLG